MRASTYYILLIATVAAYFYASKYLFDKVYGTTEIVVDELFHIPQGLAYCNRNFTYWNGKITTLPGLYLMSTAVLGTYFDCNTYNLRFTNLVASCVNLLLFSSILRYVYGQQSPSKTLLQAVSLALLPPLYFFSHLYYTDTMSLMFLLGYSRLCLSNNNKILILILGACSILMRQTNVVWIAMIFGHKLLDLLIKSSRVYGNQYISDLTLSKTSLIAKDIDKSKLRRYYSLYDVFVSLKYHLGTCGTTFFRFVTWQDFLALLTHTILLSSFVAYVVVNGSIVVGDKTAHQVTLHLPQLLYYILFYGVFGLPHVLAKISSTLRLMIQNKLVVFSLSVLFLAIVHFNTVVHPYMVADNRHYLFYVWNRWFGKYDFAIYATVPVYVFLFFNLYDNLRHQNCVSFLLPYSVCLIAALALQKLIEIRYFLVPYIVLRLRFGHPSYKVILLELLWYVLLNAATFYVFFNKEIYWKDFSYAQRIIW